jgi:hypothetical protein
LVKIIMNSSLSETIHQIRSLSLFVPEDGPHMIFRLEPAEKIEPSDPGFPLLLEKIYEALHLNRVPDPSELVDIWALDLWEYNREEFDYFSRYPERFTGFSECGIARVLSHIALTLDLGGSKYLFVMYRVSTKAIDLRADIPRGEYETLLEALPF